MPLGSPIETDFVCPEQRTPPKNYHAHRFTEYHARDNSNRSGTGEVGTHRRDWHQKTTNIPDTIHQMTRTQKTHTKSKFFEKIMASYYSTDDTSEQAVGNRLFELQRDDMNHRRAASIRNTGVGEIKDGRDRRYSTTPMLSSDAPLSTQQSCSAAFAVLYEYLI